MKKLFVLALAALFTVSAFAQNKQKGTPEERADKVTNRMKEKLNLSDEQVAKIKAINLDAAKKKEELKATKKDEKILGKKKKLTAVERKRLKEAEGDELKALKEQLRAEKEAERERIKQASIDERKRIIEERKKACADDPKSKGCKTAKLQLTKILEKIKIKSLEEREKDKEAKSMIGMASLEMRSE